MYDDDDGWHTCHFCGTFVKDGYEDKEKTKRHYLSDCRPDLVEHEPGETCTWAGDTYNSNGQNCYAYQERDTQKWGDEHKHFYSDGPM